MNEAILQFLPYFSTYLLFAGGYYYVEKYRLDQRTNTFPNYTIVIIIFMALAIRLFLAGYEYGGMDVDNFAAQADTAYSGGNLYNLKGFQTHNYPPFNIFFLLFWKHVSVLTSLPFTFLYRLTYIFIDIIFILLVLRLPSTTRIHKENIALLIAVSPVFIIVNTIIGQIDIMPTFFAFLAFVLIKENQRHWKWSALLLGLGICAKMHPIILLPAFLYEFSSKKRIVSFTTLTLAPPIILLSAAAFIYPNSKEIFTNVIFFKGHPSGAWGFGGLFWICARFFEHFMDIPVAKQWMETLWEWHKSQGTVLFYFYVGIGFLTFFRKNSLLKRIIYTYLGFYVFTNYCSPSHVVWIVPFLLYCNFPFSAGFLFWANMTAGAYAPVGATGRLHLDKIPKLYPIVAGCLWIYACYSLVSLMAQIVPAKSSGQIKLRLNQLNKAFSSE